MFIEQEHQIIWWQGKISTKDDFQNITENAVLMKRQYYLVTFTSSSDSRLQNRQLFKSDFVLVTIIFEYLFDNNKTFQYLTTTSNSNRNAATYFSFTCLNLLFICFHQTLTEVHHAPCWQ